MKTNLTPTSRLHSRSYCRVPSTQSLATTGALALLVATGLLLSPQQTEATPIFFGGNATITHDADIGDTDPASAVTAVNPLPGSLTTQYSATINQTVGGSSASSTGTGGINHFEGPGVFGFNAPGGMGVNQSDTDAVQVFSGAASLRIDFAATWDFTSQFGPDITYFINAPITGVVGAGTGGFVQLNIVATATAKVGTAAHTWGGTMYTQNTPGAFSLFTGVEELQPGDFFAQSNLGDEEGSMSGYIEFIARSGTTGASSINFSGPASMIPEPASLAMMGIVSGLGYFIRKRLIM